MGETRSALVSQESVEARGVTTWTPAVARGVFTLISAMLALTRDNSVRMSLDRLELAYDIRDLAGLRAT